MSNFLAILFALVLIQSTPLNADTSKTTAFSGNRVGKVTITNVPLRDDCFPVTKKPILLKVDTPDYPDSLISHGIQGKVIIAMLIELDGAITKAEISKSSEHGTLDTLALHAAYLFKFKPVILHGKRRVKVWVSYSFLFEITKLDSRLRGNDTSHR